MNAFLSIRCFACLVILLAIFNPKRSNAPPQPLPAEALEGSRLTTHPAGVNQSLAWFSECVECPTQLDDMSDRSLHLDANGYAHIAYGEISLYHAWEDAGGWHREVVDETPGTGFYAALDLDNQGFAYISYYDATNADLRYAYQDASGWHIRIADSDGLVGQHTSLAIDADHYAHISYYDESNHTLKFAHQEASGWTLNTLDSAGENGEYSSLVLDSAGFAHVSYYAKTGADLRYIYQDQAGWHSYTVVSTGSVGMYSSLALDHQGRRHVSFYNDSNQTLNYIRFSISQSSLTLHKNIILAVTSESAPAGLNAYGRYTSIAVDQNDKAHMVYSTYQCVLWNNNDCWSDEPRNLMYTFDDGTEPPWPTQIAGYIGEHGSLALNAAGKPRVSYLNEKFGNLVYSQSSGGAWTSKNVEEGGIAGLYPSLALNAAGEARISYFDGVSDYLQYAARSSTGWSIETVKTSGTTSTIAWGSGHTSLVLDAAQSPHISYYTGEGQQVLHYTYQDQAGWHILTADTGNAGNYSSLELDASGYARISYYKGAIYGSSVEYDLKYVSQDETSWHPVSVDQPGDVGRFTSLELDSGGRPYISYYDDSNANLKLTYLDGSGLWQFVVVDRTGDVGQYTSLGLDASNFPHISYYDVTNGDLCFAFQDPSGWYTQTLDSQGDVGLYTSLALDGEGHAHISYYDKTNGDLKYAYQDQDGWHVDLVDERGDVGMYSSLALDGNERPHIAYHDNGNKGLLYAYLGEAVYAVSLSTSIESRAGNLGGSVEYGLQVTNLANVSDTFRVALSGFQWDTAAPAEIGPLAPGTAGSLIVTVNIPAGAAMGATDQVTVTVTSRGDPAKSAQIGLTTTAGLRLFIPFIKK